MKLRKKPMTNQPIALRPLERAIIAVIIANKSQSEIPASSINYSFNFEGGAQ